MNPKIKEILRKTLLVLCIFVFVLSTGKLIYSLYTGYQVKKEAHNLANEVVKSTDSYNTIDKVDVDFDKLISRNPDTVAWLQIPDTPVNYPIVHRNEDNQTYLDTNFDGDHSIYGTIFLDGYNKPDFNDRVSFIFGHNVSTSLTFGEKTYFTCLYDYADQNFMDSHKKIFINTKDQKLEYTVLGAIHVNEYTDLYKTKFNSENEYTDYLQKLSTTLGVDTSMLNSNSKIIALSTCLEAKENTTERMLVFAYR